MMINERNSVLFQTNKPHKHWNTTQTYKQKQKKLCYYILIITLLLLLMLLIFEIQMIKPQADCYAKTHIEFYAFVGIVNSRLIYKEIQVFFGSMLNLYLYLIGSVSHTRRSKDWDHRRIHRPIYFNQFFSIKLQVLC